MTWKGRQSYSYPYLRPGSLENTRSNKSKGTVTNGRGETEGSGDDVLGYESMVIFLQRARLPAEGETEGSGDRST